MAGHTTPDPGRPADGSAAPSPASGQAAAFLGLVALPVLAFVSAVMGLILVLNGKVVAGLVFLLVLTQAFAVGGLVLWMRRRRGRAQR